MIINSNAIKIAIINKGLTQIQVADMVGITEVTLSKWVNGKLGNIHKFLKLMYILNIKFEDLVK